MPTALPSDSESIDNLVVVSAVATQTRFARTARALAWVLLMMMPVIAISVANYVPPYQLGKQRDNAKSWMLAIITSVGVTTIMSLWGVGVVAAHHRKYGTLQSLYRETAIHVTGLLACLVFWYLGHRVEVYCLPNRGVPQWLSRNWIGNIQVPSDVVADEDLMPFFIQEEWFHEWNGPFLAGLCDRSGRIVVPATFQNAHPFREGRCVVQDVNDRYGILDAHGLFVLRPQERVLSIGFYEERLQFEVDGKVGFLDHDGHAVVQPKYDRAQFFKRGLAAVMLDKKWGYIDRDGRVLIPLQFMVAYPFNEKDLAVVRLEEGSFWFVDRSGKKIRSLYEEEIAAAK